MDILASLMGAMDIVAGVLLLIFLNSYSIAIVFGILMIGKGAMSFFEF